MSIWHLLIILVILLMVFGPSRLEGIGSSLGKAIRGFKKGLDSGEEDSSVPKKEKEAIDVTEESNKTPKS